MRRYDYDAFNRLTAVREQNATDDVGHDRIRIYGYDAEGNRLFERRAYMSDKDVERLIPQPTPRPYTVKKSVWKTLAALDEETYAGVVTADPEFYTDPPAARTPLTDAEEPPTAQPAPSPATERLPFFWYGFGQSLTRTLTTPPIGEWMSAAWHAIWKIEGDEVVTIDLPEAKEPPAAPLLTDAEKEELQEEIERELPEEFTEAEQIKESKYVTVQPTQPPAKVEEYTIDYLEYDLIWYVNDVNREHTEVLMTRREDRAFTRSYTYGNERLTWDYGAWKGGSKNLWNYYAWKYLPTQPSIHGQYVNDGRGSASMLLDTTSNNTQLSHYYEPYGETLTDGSLAPSTRRAQAGVWDFFGFNGEDYDASTGMSYLRARYLSIEVGAFITEDTVKGNIFNPASLNLRGYVEGNPVAYIDPSGHSVKSVWDSIVDTIGGWINPKPQIVYIELPPTPSPTPKPTPTLQPTLTPTLPPKPTPPLTPTPAPESSHSLIPEVPVGKTKKDQAQDVWKGREDVWRKTWQGVMNELSKCGSLGSNLTSTERMAILLLAAAYIGPGVGYKYSSKDKENYYRNALFEKVVDCSGLVKAAVKAAGMDLHGSSGDIFKTMKANGWLTEATTYEEFLNSGLLPGDLLFWVNKNPTSDGYGETSHVGFYLYTDEKGEVWILDSTGSENGPNVQKLWQDKKETGKHRYQAYAKLGQLP